jgi:branched-chain amino acid transport system substrate-binding protein
VEVAAPIASQLKVPMLTSTSTKPGVVDDSPWAFRVGTTDEEAIPPAVDAYLKVYPNVKKVVIVGDSQAAVTAGMIKNIWPKVLPQKGLTVTDTVTFESATTDFSAIATRIKASGADGIAVSAFSPALPNLMKELERQGVKMPIITSPHVFTVPPLPQVLGPTADGLVIPMLFNPDRRADPKVGPILEEYQKLAQAESPNQPVQPIGFAAEPQTYDTFALVMQVMRESGVNGSMPVSDAREKIRAALSSVKAYQGLSGEMTADSNRNITFKVTPGIAKDGAWTAIK